MTDTFRRLQSALPQVLVWVDRLLEENARFATGIDLRRFARLPRYWSSDVLLGARVVKTSAVPFPPVSAYGLPEFAAMENMSRAAITFRDMFFVDEAHDSESVHFHELVHVVQWDALGPPDFLLTYGVGLAEFGYRRSPLEAMAYDLQASFERGVPIPNLKASIKRHACQTRASAAAVLEQRGIELSVWQAVAGPFRSR